MAWKEDIIKSIQSIAALSNNTNNTNNKNIICTVIDIDTATNTCTCLPIDGVSGPITNVLMVADLNTEPTSKPNINSQVMVSLIDNNTGYISLGGSVKSVALAGKDFGGMVIVEELVKKLNNIENLLNNLIGVYNQHTHVVASFGTSATPLPIESSTVSPTVASDIENIVVNHGSGATDNTQVIQARIDVSQSQQVLAQAITAQQIALHAGLNDSVQALAVQSAQRNLQIAQDNLTALTTQ